MSKKISIIVPIYNIEKYLHQCLRSIINQTYKNIEIILVDDGSVDNCPQICDEYADIDSRIKVIHKQNEGLVRARKIGLMASTGELIGFVDGDDWVEPDMFGRLYDVLSEQAVDIAMCGRYEDTGDTYRKVYHGISQGRYDKTALINKVYPNMIVNGAFFEWGLFPGVWDKLFRREALLRHQMSVDDRLTMGEDAACTYPALLNAQSIYVLQECLYHYRQSAGSMVKQNTDIELMRERFRILYNSVNKIFGEYRYIYDLREQWKEYILFLMVPRAGQLYKNIDRLDYLFPFPGVHKGSNIIIYGMGTYGQLLYKFVRDTNFCNVAACADRNFEELRKQGLKVIAPDDIESCEYDAIVVANSFAGVRKSIYRELTARFPGKNIYVMDESLIKSEETLAAFGLL